MIPTTLLKAANSLHADREYHRSVEKKFKTLAPHVHRSGVYTGVTKRILIPKRVLTEKDLTKHLGFVPDPLAIPEAGQRRLTSFRNPMHEYHLHDHGDVWAMHHDEHPAANMLVLRAKIEAAKGKGTGTAPKKVSIFKMIREGAKGAPHAIREGLPAYAAYLRGRLRKEPGMREQVARGLPKSYTDMVAKMPSSRYHQESEKAAAKSFQRKVIGEGAIAPKGHLGTAEALPDPLSEQKPRPRVPGLPVPRRPSVKFFPHDKGLQKGTIPAHPFSGNTVRT
jgi:hypothetical protein